VLKSDDIEVNMFSDLSRDQLIPVNPKSGPEPYNLDKIGRNLLKEFSEHQILPYKATSPPPELLAWQARGSPLSEFKH
jgi:hypothetical protein